MAEPTHSETLYQQALSAALGELRDINAQIDQLRAQIDRLERKKAAVESIRRAIGQWVETQASDTQGGADPATDPD